MELAMKDNGIKKAYEILETISKDELKRIEYTSYQKKIMDETSRIADAKRQGKEIGLKEGEEKTIKSVEAKMRARGLSEEFIKEILETNDNSKPTSLFDD